MSESNVSEDGAELYDQENDVYYVSFGTCEPSYSIEVDDIFVLDVGFFTNLPTGYRVLNMSRMRMWQLPVDEIKRQMIEVLRSLPTTTKNDREAMVEQSLQKVFAPPTHMERFGRL